MSLTVGTNRDRDQAIETYKALLKKKKDLSRKNRALQTKISQYIRKNKIDLEGNIDKRVVGSRRDLRSVMHKYNYFDKYSLTVEMRVLKVGNVLTFLQIIPCCISNKIY